MARSTLTSLTPNQLFILFAVGISTIYGSIFWPKIRILGLAGVGCALAVLYVAPEYRIQPVGLFFLGTAVILYGLEFVWKLDCVAGLAGAILLPAGFEQLYSGQQRIAATLAIPLGLALGLATAALCRTAKQARMNKISDL
jgi:membrane-bound ClpP family serine protease